MIAKITPVGTIRIFDGDCRTSVIPRSVTGQLLRQSVHRIRAVYPCIIRISRKSSICIREQIIHVSRCPASIIQMQQKTKRIYLHLIGRVHCMQCKQLLFFIIKNAHFTILHSFPIRHLCTVGSYSAKRRRIFLHCMSNVCHIFYILSHS